MVVVVVRQRAVEVVEVVVAVLVAERIQPMLRLESEGLALLQGPQSTHYLQRASAQEERRRRPPERWVRPPISQVQVAVAVLPQGQYLPWPKAVVPCSLLAGAGGRRNDAASPGTAEAGLDGGNVGGGVTGPGGGGIGGTTAACASGGNGVNGPDGLYTGGEGGGGGGSQNAATGCNGGNGGAAGGGGGGGGGGTNVGGSSGKGGDGKAWVWTYF